MAYFENCYGGYARQFDCSTSLPIFYGLASENPSSHIDKLEEAFSGNEVAMLQVFSSSLQGNAKCWFRSLDPRSFFTWEQVEKQFFKKFSPMYETHVLLQEITTFCQLDEESFEDCWLQFRYPILYWSRHTCDTRHLVRIFYEGLNPTTRKLVDTMYEGEFLDETANKSWDYFDELAEISRSWVYDTNLEDANLNTRDEEEIEPLFVNEGAILALKEISEVKWDDEPDFDYAPQEDSSCTLDMPLHEKTFEVNTGSTFIESPPSQELEKIELIDFLGVDNFDWVYNPGLVDLVNHLKINLVQIIYMVELKFLKRIRRSLHSKYLILWYGRVQFLTKSLEWSGLCIVGALHSRIEIHVHVVNLIRF